MDRRTVWAILLMMAIAITPAIFLKRPARPNPAAPTTATIVGLPEEARTRCDGG